MALVRIDEKTIVQKFKTSILGKEKPNWMTRFSVLLGFGFWFYFILWFSIIFMSILFLDRLESPELIRSTFAKIGGRYNFNIDYTTWGLNAIDVIFYHALICIVTLLLSLLGLILIYRRKKWGYFIYLTSHAVIIIFTILFLGMDYTIEQIGLIDKIIFLAITAYFLIAMLFLRQSNKKIKTKEPLQD